MPNIVALRPADAVPQEKPEILDVTPILTILDMLYKASAINDNDHRLGYIVAAHFQQQGSFLIPLTWETAAVTWVTVDGAPASGATNTSPEDFARSLTMLQALCGLYSHHTRAGVIRAKDRFTSFACDLRGTASSTFKYIAQDTTVFFQWRPSMYPTLMAEAQAAVERRMWTCKFAHISTKGLE